MVELNAKIFWARVGKLLDIWNVREALDFRADPFPNALPDRAEWTGGPESA